MKHRILTATIALILSCLSAAAQQDNFSSFSEYLSPEKLYLHTDRDVYCAGDTVWFKGYLRNASVLSHYAECNYIYVDLISTMVETDANLGRDIPKERVRARVKVKRNWEGCFSGYIPVPQGLCSSIAVLRGYSYWMLNKEPEYMFNKNIEIRNPIKDDYARNLEESQEKNTSKYTELGVANPFEKEKKVTHDVDVQFLPESGRYLSDTQCTMGVKAVSRDGLGAEVKGKIYAGSELLAEFATSALGFARVELNVPSTASRIYAQLTDDEGLSKKVDLPLPESEAAVIRCSVSPSVVRAEIITRGIRPMGALRVIAYDRNEIYFEAPYDPRQAVIEFPYDQLTPGINNIALADEVGNVYAERAVFVCPPEEVVASVSSDKADYASKEKVSCTFTLGRGEGRLASGDFSVSVMDDGYAPVTGEGYNVVSYMYLGSELPTFVEDSRRYFDTSRPLEERLADADLLMLTQAWKYYDLGSILSGTVPLPLCGKEYTQSIAGKILIPFSRKAKKANVSFVAPSIRYSSIHQLDTTGAFVLSGLDFPQGTQFLVGAESLGGNRLYTPVLDHDVYAKEHSYTRYLTPAPYDYMYKVAAMPEYYNEDGTPMLVLNSSYVTANRTSAQKNISPFPEYEFKPGQYRTPEQMQPYQSYDIASYVTVNFPSVRIDTTSAGEYALLCRTNKVSTQMTISSGWDPVIIYINRMEASYSDLLQYTIGDLEGLAYLSGTDAMRFNTWATTTSPRSVLMIKTREVSKTPPNVASIKPMGWQRPARMYSPAYTTAQSKRAPESIRPTLYWNPELEVDESGKATFEFYTSGHFAPCTVVVEGITIDGVPVFATSHIERN